MQAFWVGVAQLGGYQNRKGDDPPGWKTIRPGWQYLNDLVHGAQSCQAMMLRQQIVDAMLSNVVAVPGPT